MNRKMCPMKARGWLSSKWAYSSDETEMQEVFNRVTGCDGRGCACWDDRTDKCGFISQQAAE